MYWMRIVWYDRPWPGHGTAHGFRFSALDTSCMSQIIVSTHLLAQDLYMDKELMTLIEFFENNYMTQDMQQLHWNIKLIQGN